MRSVDERVVEMRFDNKDFENGVRESMSTLNRFESSLDSLGSTRGIDGINRAISNITFTPLENGIAIATKSFSFMESVANKVMFNITSSVAGVVTDLLGNVSSADLTLKQISAGWDKYADKTSSVQTIMAATAKDFTDTGEQMEYVNEQLDKLNWFTDETSYNFVDMTNNIGKFTSNGIKLDKSVEAMQGIANWAAISGANAGEASRAMYNLSQALATGSVKLIDWKSIENANMATAEFKEMAIEAAEALGTLKKTGEDTWTTLDGKQQVSVTNFNEGLSKGWFSSEVLMSTLSKYGEFTSVLNEAMDDMGDAYDTTSQLLKAIDEYAEGELDISDVVKETGLTTQEVTEWFDKLSDSTYDLGRRSFKAAQEAKTFQEAIDATKDAVSTGWMNVFQKIFGDYQEAKEIWTDLANELWEVFAAPISDLNDVLDTWREAGGREDLFGGIADAWDSIKEIMDVVKDAFYDIFDAGEKFYVLTQAIMGPDGWTVGVSKSVSVVYSLSKAVKDLGAKLKNWVSVEENLNKISRIAKGVFSIFNIGKKVISGIFSVIKSGLSSIDGGSFLDILASIGDFFVELDSNFSAKGIFDEIFSRLTGIIKELVWFVNNLFNIKEQIDDWGNDIGGIFASVFNVLIINPIQTAVRIIGRLLGKEGDELFSFTERIIAPLNRLRNFLYNFLESFRLFKFKMPDFSGFEKFVDRTAKRLSPLKAIGEALKNVFGGLVEFLKPVGNFLLYFAKRVGDALWGMIDRLLTMMTEGDFNGIFDLVNSGVLTVLGVQIAGLATGVKGLDGVAGKGGWSIFESIKNFVEFFKNPKEGLAGIAGGLKDLVKGILPLGDASTAGTDNVKTIAEAIGILAGSLLLLSLIDSEKLGDAVAVITALFAELIGTVKLMSGIELAVSGVVKLSVAVLILSAALKNIASLDGEQLAIGVSGMLGVILEMLLMFKGMSMIDVEGTAGAVLIFSFAMISMGTALKILGSLDSDQLKIALSGFAKSMWTIRGAFKAIKGEDIIKTAGAIFILAEAMIRMGVGLKIMSTMGIEEMVVALLSFAGTMAIIVASFKMLRLYDLVEVAASILILSEAMIRMGVALKIMGSMSWQEMGVALVSFAGSMAVIVATFKLLKYDAIVEVAAAILILSFAMTQMGIALKIMGSLRVDQMIVALVAFAGVMGIFVGMVDLMDSSAGRMAGVAAALIVLSIGLTTLAVAMKLMGLLSLGDILKSLLALGGTLVVLAGAAALLGPLIPMMVLVGVAFGAAGAGLILFGTGLVTLAAGIASTVALLDVGAESILMAIEIIIVGVLTAISKSIDAIVSVFQSIVRAIIIVIRDSVPELVEVTLFALASIVESLLKYLPTAVEGLLVVIDQLMESLSVHVPIIVGYLVDLVINVLNTLAEKIPFFVDAVVNIIRTFIDAVINALNGLDMENLRNGIIAFGLVSVFMGALAGAAMLAPMAMAGVLAVGAVITEMTLVLAAIGALNKIPGIAEFAESGGDLLQIVGEAIGKFLGGIVGGIAEGTMSALPKMGEYLSEFMDNVQPFIEGAKNIDPSVMDSVTSLVGVMMLLTAAELLDQLVGWVANDSGSALADFGDELIEFAPKLVEFGEKVKDVNAEQVQGAADATLTLAKMAAEIPNSGGLLGAITGENSLKDFGSELVMYAPNLIRFARLINESGVDISGETMRGVSEATIALAQMANEIPNSGGLVAMITGENSLSQFGSELALYGPKLIRFANSVIGVTAEQLDGAISASLALINMAKEVPKTGGLVSLITGKNSLSEFGKEMAEFGGYLSVFSYAVKDVDATQVSGAAEASEKLVGIASLVPKTGGLLASVTGKNSIAAFGKELVSYGDQLSKYSQTVQGINLDMVQGSIDATGELITMGTGVNGTGGIASLISGNNSIAEFGKELASYAPNLVKFASTVSEAGVTSTQVAGAAAATKELGKMAEELPKTDGWINSIMGKNSLSSFGTELAGYGQPLAEFAGAVNGKVSKDMVQGAADATIALAGMVKDIPAEGGLVQKITGKNSLATFGDELRPYGKDLTKFAQAVTGINKDDVIGAAEATGELTKMAQGIPFEGGLVERITGKNSLADFGDELKEYGKSLSKFAVNVEGISLEQVQGAIDATKAVTDMASQIPYDSLAKMLNGKTSLSMFGYELEDFAEPFNEFASVAATVEPGIDTKSKEIATAVTELMNGLPVISARVDFEALGDQLRSFGRDFNKFYSRIADVDTAKFTAVVDGLNAISKISKDISNINGKGLVQLASGMSDISTEGVTGFVSSFTNSAGSVKDSAAGMVGGAIDGILSMGHSLFTVVSSIGTGIVNTFQQSIPYQIFKSITENQFILAIISAINSRRGQIVSAVSTVGSDIVTQLRNNLNSSTIFNLGLMVPKGLSDGMLAGLPQLNATASRMGQIVSDAIRNRLKIHSPSEETYEDGAYVILGAINGMEAYADRLKTTTEDITEQSMLDPIREAIASVNDDGTIDSETQPVIRPVLDLSEIQNGYKQINSLFDEQYRVDMQARMGKMETSSAINPEQIDQIEDAIRSINNNDVINEMETLRNDISNLKDAMTRLQVVMNSGTLVGELVDPMDAALGMKALQNSRGRY